MSEPNPCECGCGVLVSRRFVHGHNRRGNKDTALRARRLTLRLEVEDERRRLVPQRTPEDRQLADLKAVIHLLAMMMTEGKSVA